ncbi:MAG: hypothetical protein JWR59_1304 [Brevundimonas sp.]|nr:hypothetical protein [Brevundimonas sp.]
MAERDVTVGDRTLFHERLKGPLGAMLREAGAIIARKLRERHREMNDISDVELAYLFHSAILEAAAHRYPNNACQVIAEVMDGIFANVILKTATNVQGNTTLH